MEEQSVLSTEHLLAEVGWLRRLARRLVADEHLADDLAQDTLVAALEHTRAGSVPSRAWLRRVLHNFLRQFARGAGHRHDRELRAARVVSARGADAWLLEVEAQRELLEAVLELDEPYRRAIVLRYLRSTPPREIARELELPVSTVSSRISIGLERLRARLAARRGETGSWVALLLPLALAPTHSKAGLLGALLVNTKVVVAAVALAAVGAWWTVVALRPHSEVRGESTELATKPSRSSAPSSSPGGAASPSDDRHVVSPDTDASAPKSAAAVELAPLRTVRGRALDASGAPAARVALGVSNESRASKTTAACTTDATGGFEFETRLAQGFVASADASQVTVRSGVFRSESTLQPIVIVAAALDLSGEIVDEHGDPLGGARIALEVPRDFDARFSESLEATYHLGWSANSDEHGHFELAHVPLIDAARLRVALDGYVPHDEPTPTASRADLRIELARPTAPLAGALAGVVLDAANQKVPEARVALGLASVLTDANGEFRIDLARAATTDTLRAVKPGYLPAVLERPFEPRAGDGGWPEFVEVRLPGPSLDFQARVVDENGAAVAGARVSLADPTPFGVIGMMPTTLESLASGAPVPAQAIASQAQLPEHDGDNYNDMRMRPGPPSAFWNWARTDAEGRFELGGLTDRSYRVRIFDDATLAEFTSDPIPAGARDVVITMPRPKLWEKLEGRVLSKLGGPLGDVALTLVRDTYGVNTRVWGGRVDIRLVQPRETVRTDAQGRFTFANVPREGAWLTVQAPAIVPTDFQLERVKDERDVVISVDVRCQLEVVLDAPFERADQVRLLDADDRQLDALVITEGSVNAFTELRLVDGKSGVFSASSAAAVLVLLKDGAPVARHAIRLQPGEKNLLRY